MSESSPLRILLIDETPESESFVARSLCATVPLTSVRRVAGPAELAEELERAAFDVVVTEARLSWTDGLAVHRSVKKRHADRPILMLTDQGDEDLAVSALRAGFDDYVRKAPDQGDRLAEAVSSALKRARERAAYKQAEQSVVAEPRRLAAETTLILEQMLDAVIVTDSQGRYALVNEAAGRLLGMDPAALVGLRLDEQPWKTFDESGEYLPYEERPIVRALRGERASMIQRIQTLDGRELIARAASAPVRDETGTIVGVVHVVHDVTEEYVRAQQAAEGARLRSLGQLAGGVAHDLNQFLGMVIGYGDLALAALRREIVDIEAVHDSITTMIRAAENGAEGVRRLLLFARPAAEGPASRVELDEVLREVAKLTAPRWRDAAQQQGRPISVDLEVEGEVAIDGWPNELREVFTNLVLNAVDALPTGGVIRLAARPRAGQVVAEVGDNGTGMAAETRERLFEPFFSTKGESGSGLGLAIVFGIVERHGGTISVDSAPGSGTTFRLTFSAAARAEEVGAKPPDQDVARQLRILVVDDEPSLVTMLARLLASDGHELSVATSGEEALTILASTPIDVVISDLGMGAGMNGWELAAAVRELPNRPHFMLATGWGAEIDPDEAATRGVLAVVPKPYRLPDLRKILNTL